MKTWKGKCRLLTGDDGIEEKMLTRIGFGF